MPACSRCLVEVPPGTALCPKCGAAIRPTVVPLRQPKRVRKTQRRLEALEGRELLFGAATLVLLISLFLPWYRIGPFTLDGLGSHGWLFIALLNCIVLVLSVVIKASGAGDLADQGRLSKEQLLALLTGINLALVVLLGFVLKPSGTSWAWGAYLALVAAAVAFAPFGIPLVQERRRR